MKPENHLPPDIILPVKMVYCPTLWQVILKTSQWDGLKALTKMSKPLQMKRMSLRKCGRQNSKAQPVGCQKIFPILWASAPLAKFRNHMSKVILIPTWAKLNYFNSWGGKSLSIMVRKILTLTMKATCLIIPECKQTTQFSCWQMLPPTKDSLNTNGHKADMGVLLCAQCGKRETSKLNSLMVGAILHRKHLTIRNP